MHYKQYEIIRISENLVEIPVQEKMKVPGRIYADEPMMQNLLTEGEPIHQVINVAQLPGIQKHSLAMPDIHWGYGFPIGGIAATDWQDGVISPGGVGYDINCGVRLAATDLETKDIDKKIPSLIKELFKAVPTGVGSSNAIRKLKQKELKSLVEKGVSWIIEQGFGVPDDLNYIEENGFMQSADADVVSSRAFERGLAQMGTLGSGNHFLEIDRVDKIYDQLAAEAIGLFENQIVIQIHTGSRGFGYQVCDDYLRVMNSAVQKYQLNLPDRQLAAAPIQSAEGQNYFSAMACAANYAWSNRQVIMHLASKVLRRVLKISEAELQFRLVYDVSHNIAKKEEHVIDGKNKTVCVHRKGATRAFNPGNGEVPDRYKTAGQPVLIPGDMGRCSFVCTGTGTAMDETFGSSCHGAGRLMSRQKAKKMGKGRDLFKELNNRGIVVQSKGRATLAEEMPDAYKNVSHVVDIMHNSGVIKKAVRLKPLGVIKG